VGQGLHFDGLSLETSRVRYPRRDECPGHDRLPAPVPLGRRAADVPLRELLEQAERDWGADTVLDLSRDVIVRLTCPGCARQDRVGAALGALTEEQALCPQCGAHRVPEFTGTIARDAPVELERTFADVGIPPLDIVTVRRGLEVLAAWVFDGDARALLGELEEDAAGRLDRRATREGTAHAPGPPGDR
jgi:hypothetical protein